MLKNCKNRSALGIAKNPQTPVKSPSENFWLRHWPWKIFFTATRVGNQ